MIEPAELVGKKILVGITRLLDDGAYEQDQFVGMADIEDRGSYCLINLKCSDGEVRSYPFDTRSLQRAEPGDYRLRSTGDIVRDPDFTMSWEVHQGNESE